MSFDENKQRGKIASLPPVAAATALSSMGGALGTAVAAALPVGPGATTGGAVAGVAVIAVAITGASAARGDAAGQVAFDAPQAPATKALAIVKI